MRIKSGKKLDLNKCQVQKKHRNGQLVCEEVSTSLIRTETQLAIAGHLTGANEQSQALKF